MKSLTTLHVTVENKFTARVTLVDACAIIQVREKTKQILVAVELSYKALSLS